jgi:hypothetical protein
MRIWILLLVFIVWANTACAGNFSITSANTADIDMSFINDGTGDTKKNAGAATSGKIGNYYGDYMKILIRFNTLADSMQQVYADSGEVTWDSAKVTINAKNYRDADSMWIVAYKIIREGWVEGVVSDVSGIDSCGVCWDSANAVNYVGCAGVTEEWGTAGCDNITTDRSNTRETIGSHPDSILIVTAVYLDYDIYISQPTIADTMGGGILIDYVAIGVDDLNPLIFVYSDDYAGATVRPELQVWYHVGAESFRRRRMLND